MFREYLSYKFTKLTDGAETRIRLKLKDFWVEQYATDGTGKQVLVALVGGEINNLCVAKVKAEVRLEKDAEEYIKNISAYADGNYVQGVGTGTASSSIYRGSESIEYVHAKNINNAFNKLIMQVNGFLEEHEL
jgi:hypothetical protein